MLASGAGAIGGSQPLAATLVAVAEYQNNPPTTPFVLKVIVFEYKR